ncbi:transcription initiation factor IIA subunit 1-like isoform X1 [Rhynchophorus ferrugineus]|uniref:transcription initiation factor IIA subunit 1-like isoform X1 n=1 Tax=Rhynchophorus ferrugineus TaxID=354439 RepID=UPI003FCD102F
MSNSLCKSSVSKAYQEVIADVIQNVREHFVEDGVDEIVLQELKTLWETKLANTKAVEDVKEIDKLIAVNKNQKTQQNPIQHNFLNPLAQQHNSVNNQPIGQVPPNNHIPQAVAFPEWKRVPVKLTIPSPSGCNTPDKRILSIYVPELFLQADHLKSILTGPIISKALNLSLDAATTFLQDQINNTFIKHQQATNIVNINMGVNPSSIIQTDGNASFVDVPSSSQPNNSSVIEMRNKHRKQKSDSHFKNTCTKDYSALSVPLYECQSFSVESEIINCRIYQGDGSHDSSDDEQIDDEDEDDNDNEDADDAADENDDGNQEVIEDEPLNSEDDVSDADGTEESFDTENVIVCQFDKITRARNRWKFHLKDGIMNLNGEDYVFQKANGDAEW